MDIAFPISKRLFLSEEGDVAPVEEDPGGEDRAGDRGLLADFMAGDRDAFAALYRRHAKAVFQFAYYMAGDADMADELTQEVFVWLIQHPAAFDPARGDLAAFLGGVARKFLRRRQRSQSRWAPLEDAVHRLQAMSLRNDPSLAQETVADTNQLRQAIARLPVRYREPVVLCDLQEKPYAEAARVLGCSVGTIRSRLHRGRQLLGRKLRLSAKDEAHVGAHQGAKDGASQGVNERPKQGDRHEL